MFPLLPLFFNLFRYFSRSFLSLFSATPIMQMLVHVMSQISLRLFSFLYFFILFHGSDFHHGFLKIQLFYSFSSGSVTQSCLTLCNPMGHSMPGPLSITNSWSPPKPMPIESVMPSSHLILCCPLLFLPSIFPSIRVFSNESALCIRWPKYWSFSFNISPSSEHPGLISFTMDWLALLAVQGTLKSLLQHHSSKASILQRSAFFTVQLFSSVISVWYFLIFFLC